MQELWQLAELGTPQFAENGTALLTFDDVALVLSCAPTEEEMWVTAEVGPMTGAQSGHPDRLHKVLGLSFAFLASHDVLVTLENERLCVSGAYPFKERNVHVLSALISDVVSATETLKRVMPDGAGKSLVKQAENLPLRQDLVVFQP